MKGLRRSHRRVDLSTGLVDFRIVRLTHRRYIFGPHPTRKACLQMTDSTHCVADVTEALHQLGLPADKRVLDLGADQVAAFHKLIGWDPGGPVIAYPSTAEVEARAKRETWKAKRAGNGADAACLWMADGQIEQFKRNVASDPDTAVWWNNVLANAQAVAELPLPLIAALVPEQGPWTFAGSFCPHCVGERSPIIQHAGFWEWSVLEPDVLKCPYCDIVYPHPDFPEQESLELPRLGLNYPFHKTRSEQDYANWRDGSRASNFAGMPTHVSFNGEIRTTKLAWCLGQIEPLSVAYAVTGEARYAEIVTTILGRLADVYANYPVFSYGQEYVDADPAYAVEHIEDLPTPFRRAASMGTYTGVYAGRTGNRGMDATTCANSHYTNAEWGSSRLGREKASNGQLFLTLFKGYDLVKQTISRDERTRIERDFLLELYLDTRGFSKRVNNKSGPGAASRVAVGIFYDDEEALDEGLSQFHEIMESQFYPDGSWKETPIYGAKSMMEGMSEIPEMLLGRVDLYADPLYRQAFETYAELATPLDTQPAIGDSTADFKLAPYLVDIARIRLGLPMSYGPASMAGFGVRSPDDISTYSGYTPALNCITTDEHRAGLDGPIGFGSVGHMTRLISKPSWIGMFNEDLPAAVPADRPAVNRLCSERNLICLGFGHGERATQLYCDGGDGRTTHRHQAPLSLLLFADGREVFPDQGYIGDHPTNAWIKSTPAHNTVVIDESNAQPASRTTVKGFIGEGAFRFFDVETDIPTALGVSTLRRAVLLLPRPDGLPVLVDVFDVTGGSVHDYIVRVNDPNNALAIGDLSFSDRDPLYGDLADPGPFGFRTAGQTAEPFTLSWGREKRTWAHVLTAAEEVMTFKSPAWRDRIEAFEQPDRAWDAMILRRAASTSRHIVVYDIGGSDPWITDAQLASSDEAVNLALQTNDGSLSVTIGDGSAQVS